MENKPSPDHLVARLCFELICVQEDDDITQMFTPNADGEEENRLALNEFGAQLLISGDPSVCFCISSVLRRLIGVPKCRHHLMTLSPSIVEYIAKGLMRGLSGVGKGKKKLSPPLQVGPSGTLLVNQARHAV